jgi:flagellin-like protein
MFPPLKNKKAISALISTLLLIVLTVMAAGLIFIFTNESMDNFLEEASKCWKLRIGNVGFNQSCMRIHITNIGEKDATLEKVYINDELRAFRLLDNDLNIPVDGGKQIYIFGVFNPGCNYKIKVVFESGYAIGTTERY